MSLPEVVGQAFRQGVVDFRRGLAGGRPIAAYAEHNDRRFQGDFVIRLRVAVKLNLARAKAELWHRRENRAILAARQAGLYYAEYKRHWAHLITLSKGEGML